MLECKKLAKVFDCPDCSYFSFRKANVEAHRITQHSDQNDNLTSNQTESDIPEIVSCSVNKCENVIIGSGKKLEVFAFDNQIECISKLKSVFTMHTNFEINNIECFGSNLLVTGDTLCEVLYTDIKSLFTEEISLTRKVNDFKNEASISIFFSEVEKALFVGLSTKICYRMRVLNICSSDEFDFSDKEIVEVNLTTIF